MEELAGKICPLPPGTLVRGVWGHGGADYVKSSWVIIFGKSKPQHNPMFQLLEVAPKCAG